MKLIDYIHSNTFNENYEISSNGELFFHWSNWKETCQLQKDLLDKGVDQVDFIDNALEVLKTKPVWFQRNFKTVKSNLYELYEAYLDPRIKATWHDIQKNTQVSLHHEGGPFISLTSMRWMDKSTYSFFVYRKLLTGYFPLREFRLSANIEVIARINNSPLNEMKMKITQLCKKGLVISVDGHFFSKIKNSEIVSINLSLDSFKSQRNLDTLHDFETTRGSENEAIYIKGTSFRSISNISNSNFSNGQQYYFFIPYDHIELSKKSECALDIFGNLVTIAERALEQEISTIRIEDKIKLRAAS